MKKLNLKHVLVASALAMAATFAIGTSKAEAAPNIKYISASDSVENVSGPATDVAYYAVLKKAEGNKIKKNGLKQLATGASIDLAKGEKIAETKDAYIYWAAANLTEDKELSANLTIKKNPYSKITITLDYASIDISTSSAVSLVQGRIGKDAPKPLYKKDPTKEVSASDATADTVQWSLDGKKWATLTGKVSKGDASVYLSGGFLADNMKGSTTLYFRNTATHDTRPSKAVKLKIAKAANAPKVKLDVNKMSINIKNGYDVKLSGPNNVWKSLLPYNKNGVKNTAVNSMVDTPKAVPVADKKSPEYNAVTTSYKFKNLPISILKDQIQGKEFATAGTIFLVRKSATATKPPSLESNISIARQVSGPSVVSPQANQVIATGEALEFKLPGLAKHPSDDAAAAYEYAVIAKSDYNPGTVDKVDWSAIKWKTAKSDTKITEKAKTKYSTIDGSSTEASVGTDTWVVIRRKGVKDKTLPSLPTRIEVKSITGGFEIKAINDGYKN